MRMDGDDICELNRAEIQLPFLNKYVLIGSYVEEFNKKIGDLNRVKQVPLLKEDIYKYSSMRNPFNHMSVMFNKKAILIAGNYLKKNGFEDYYLWLRMINNSLPMINIGKVLVHARVGNDMIGRRSGVQYSKDEFLFFYSLLKEKLINLPSFLKATLIRIPIRLLPKSFLNHIYIKMRN
ncbi:hypothetical protein [Flammeovirga sp. OC4]|uniref:hypothetical protein n=1 Tax=Flammeovirga sp. OC4 TaxID=1382345 RepID=UPI00069396F6|nr:hypothetical protein [Flammeovirga sp. OC4]